MRSAKPAVPAALDRRTRHRQCPPRSATPACNHPHSVRSTSAPGRAGQSVRRHRAVPKKASYSADALGRRGTTAEQTVAAATVREDVRHVANMRAFGDYLWQSDMRNVELLSVTGHAGARWLIKDSPNC